MEQIDLINAATVTVDFYAIRRHNSDKDQPINDRIRGHINDAFAQEYLIAIRTRSENTALSSRRLSIVYGNQLVDILLTDYPEIIDRVKAVEGT